MIVRTKDGMIRFAGVGDKLGEGEEQVYTGHINPAVSELREVVSLVRNLIKSDEKENHP